MKNLISATTTVILLGAIATASVGCKQTTKTVPADTAATTTTPVNTTADTSAPSGATAGTHSSAGDTAMGSHHGANGSGTMTGSSNGGATKSGAGTSDGMKKMPAVRNNTGETQGTTPGANIPVSDGSR